MRAGNTAGEPLTYFRNLVADIAARSETAMSQRHAFTVCRLHKQPERCHPGRPQGDPGSMPEPLPETLRHGSRIGAASPLVRDDHGGMIE